MTLSSESNLSRLVYKSKKMPLSLATLFYLFSLIVFSNATLNQGSPRPADSGTHFRSQRQRTESTDFLRHGVSPTRFDDLDENLKRIIVENPILSVRDKAVVKSVNKELNLTIDLRQISTLQSHFDMNVTNSHSIYNELLYCTRKSRNSGKY